VRIGVLRRECAPGGRAVITRGSDELGSPWDARRGFGRLERSSPDSAFLAIQNDPWLSLEKLLIDMADAITAVCEAYVSGLDARRSARRTE